MLPRRGEAGDDGAEAIHHASDEHQEGVAVDVVDQHRGVSADAQAIARRHFAAASDQRDQTRLGPERGQEPADLRSLGRGEVEEHELRMHIRGQSEGFVHRGGACHFARGSAGEHGRDAKADDLGLVDDQGVRHRTGWPRRRRRRAASATVLYGIAGDRHFGQSLGLAVCWWNGPSEEHRAEHVQRSDPKHSAGKACRCTPGLSRSFGEGRE